MCPKTKRSCRFAYAFASGFLGVAFTGCRSATSHADNNLPVVPASSRALPGSVNSADAPQAPRVQTNQKAVTTFRDVENGLSFQYPSAWRPLAAGSPMDPPTFTAVVGPAKGTQAFVAAGTPLAKTNLIGISFSWTAKPKLDEATCARLAADALPMGTELPGETIGGVLFHRGSGGDNGMCHHAAATVDTTLHAGRCFIFERDLETTCPDINAPGKDVDLTPDQRTALERQLDAVMSSVVLR